jgi:hypothetical protein
MRHDAQARRSHGSGQQSRAPSSEDRHRANDHGSKRLAPRAPQASASVGVRGVRIRFRAALATTQYRGSGSQPDGRGNRAVSTLHRSPRLLDTLTTTSGPGSGISHEGLKSGQGIRFRLVSHDDNPEKRRYKPGWARATTDKRLPPGPLRRRVAAAGPAAPAPASSRGSCSAPDRAAVARSGSSPPLAPSADAPH